MNNLELVIVLISFASLIVSILSFLYARRAYKIDQNRLQIEKERHEVFIDASDTKKYLEDQKVILLTKFTISNRSPSEMIVTHLTFNINFKNVDHFLPKSFVFRVIANKGMYAYEAAGQTDDFEDELVRKYGDEFQSAVIDADTGSKIDFENQTKLESSPKLYVWSALTIFPKAVLDEAEKRKYALTVVDIKIRFHNNIVKTITSHVLSTSHKLDESLLKEAVGL